MRTYARKTKLVRNSYLELVFSHDLFWGNKTCNLSKGSTFFCDYETFSKKGLAS